MQPFLLRFQLFIFRNMGITSHFILSATRRPSFLATSAQLFIVTRLGTFIGPLAPPEDATDDDGASDVEVRLDDDTAVTGLGGRSVLSSHDS